MQAWSSYAKPETKALFERVYDNTGQFYGATEIVDHGKKWLEVDMSNPELRIAKNWLMRLVKKAQHQWFMVEPNSQKPIWQVHIDVYFQKMQEHAPEMMGQQWEAQETDYADNEGKRSVFQMWLDEVPPELKMGGDLEPAFREVVREYLKQTQGFDPYEFEETEAIPSADELESWFT
jgi:hypothetical protein